jgi:hypothetical protein
VHRRADHEAKPRAAALDEILGDRAGRPEQPRRRIPGLDRDAALGIQLDEGWGAVGLEPDAVQV